MVTVLFDTNILIDQTLGHEEATDEMAAYDDAAVSVITWMETTVKLDAAEIARLDQRLMDSGITVIHTNDAIMRRAGALRALTSKKLPDCIIRATAEVEGRILITRNPSDFGGKGTQVHVPYDMRDGRVINVVAPLR